MKRFHAPMVLLSLFVLNSVAWAQEGVDRASLAAHPADSPFNSYTASAVAYTLLAGVLVTVLLVGAFLVLNLGLLSKRKEDRIGQRDPSDVRVLRHTVWPEEADDERYLPAEEDEIESRDPSLIQQMQRSQAANEKDVA